MDMDSKEATMNVGELDLLICANQGGKHAPKAAKQATPALEGDEQHCQSRTNGVKFGNKAACGGALFLKDGTIKAMFSRPASCNEFIGVDISAVKVALEVLKLAGWTKNWVVILEIESVAQ
ncbi:hypothetical protein V6N13_023177 [Hibiscus sabdariffa]